MNSRVSWSVESIDPSVRDRAEAAARRAGMSLNDWLNSTIGDSTPPDFRAGPNPRPAPRNDAPRNEPGVARQLNDAISRLDARLSQISNPAPKQTQIQDRLR